MKSSISLLAFTLFVFSFSYLKAQSTGTLYAELDLREVIEEGWFDPNSETAGLRGDQAPLNWGSTFAATDGNGDGIYEADIPFSFSSDSLIVSLKIKIEGDNNPDDGWQAGRNHTVVIHKDQKNELKLAWSDQASIPVLSYAGQVEIIEDFHSKDLKNRDLFIYLPPDYQDSDHRYPVLYLHDGQNLFDASAAGQEWQVDEAAEKLISNGEIEPVIIVGISNTSDRFDEYTPTRQHWKHELNRASAPINAERLSELTGLFLTSENDTLQFSNQNDTLMVWIPGGMGWQHLVKESDSVYYQPRAEINFLFHDNSGDPVEKITAYKQPAGGKGDIYGDFILNEVKPFVDKNLRTKPEKAFTSLGGSSLGGLITMHLGMKHPDVFSQLLVVSPSAWWDERWIIQQVEKLENPTGQKIWLDMGTAEGDQMVNDARALRDALLQKGWDNSDLHYMEAKNAPHNERAWAERFPDMLRFLYGN